MVHTRRHKPPKKTFDLLPGRKIGPQYDVVAKLGAGTEGEVYRIVESDTGIHRAAKLYYMHKDPKSRQVVWTARKLNKLRNCTVVLHYHHTQVIQIARQKVLCMISDLNEGMQLENWIGKQRGGKVQPYVALHVLYELVRGLEAIHELREYHADVHSQNILIQPMGVGFELKLIDFYNWGRNSKEKQQQDILDAIGVFSECLGGRERYQNQCDEVRYILAGLKSNHILNRFPTMNALRVHLEHFYWTRIP